VTATVSSAGLVTALAAGSATITATSEGRSGSSVVTVQQVGGRPAPMFASEFRTLGNSLTALLDSARWSFKGNGTENAVVSAAALDWPTPNALSVVAGARADGGATAENVVLIDGLPSLEVGQSRYYRWYLRVVIPDGFTGDQQTHPIQDAQTGAATNWQMLVVTHPNGTFDLQWQIGATPWPNHIWSCTVQKHVTYRVELRFTRTATGSTISSRVVDSGERVVCDDSDFTNREGAPLTSAPGLGLYDPTVLRNIQIGFNGLSSTGGVPLPMPLYYQGAVCVRADDWCGAYTAVNR
jgi:hypothetical protein